MKVWVYDWNTLPTPQIIDINKPTVDCLMTALKKVFELNARVADCEAARQGAGDLKQDWHFVKTDLYNKNRPALLFQRTYDKGQWIGKRDWTMEIYLEVRSADARVPMIANKKGRFYRQESQVGEF